MRKTKQIDWIQIFPNIFLLTLNKQTKKLKKAHKDSSHVALQARQKHFF